MYKDENVVTEGAEGRSQEIAKVFTAICKHSSSINAYMQCNTVFSSLFVFFTIFLFEGWI